jgi:hypothetical protein
MAGMNANQKPAAAGVPMGTSIWTPEVWVWGDTPGSGSFVPNPAERPAAAEAAAAAPAAAAPKPTWNGSWSAPSGPAAPPVQTALPAGRDYRGLPITPTAAGDRHAPGEAVLARQQAAARAPVAKTPDIQTPTPEQLRTGNYGPENPAIKAAHEALDNLATARAHTTDPVAQAKLDAQIRQLAQSISRGATHDNRA